MIKSLLFVAAVAFTVLPASAQTKTTTESKNKGEKKEIVIEEKSNGKSEKTVIVVDGENITINGKPAKDYDGKKHIVINDDVIIANGRAWSPSRLRVGARGQAPRGVFTTSATGFLGVVTEDAGGKGAKVKEVVEKSAAEKAGLREDDIITMVGTKKVADRNDLTAALRSMKPEETVDITYARDGASKKVKATLGKSNASTVWAQSNDAYDLNFDSFNNLNLPRVYGDIVWNGQNLLLGRPKYGMQVEDYADGNGVLVTGIDSASNAEKAGLRKDDVIVRVNTEDVKTLDSLRKQLADLNDESTFELGVLRNGQQQTLTMRVPKLIRSANL